MHLLSIFYLWPWVTEHCSNDATFKWPAFWSDFTYARAETPRTVCMIFFPASCLLLGDKWNRKFNSCFDWLPLRYLRISRPIVGYHMASIVSRICLLATEPEESGFKIEAHQVSFFSWPLPKKNDHSGRRLNETRYKIRLDMTRQAEIRQDKIG